MTFKETLKDFETLTKHKITNPLLLKAFETIWEDKENGCELINLILNASELGV